MTMTSPTHALAYAHICELLRTATAERRAPRLARRSPRHFLRSAAAGALHWLRQGQLGPVGPCTDC